MFYTFAEYLIAQTLGISGGRKDGSDRKGSEEREPERERESQRHQQNCPLHQSTGERVRPQEVKLTRTRLTYKRAHIRSTKKSVTFEYSDKENIFFGKGEENRAGK